MALIFAFSSQNGGKSNQISTGITEKVREYVTLPPMIQEQVRDKDIDYNYLLRKLSHFTEYFFLAMLAFRALLLCRIKVWKSILAAFLLCLAYAITDELHQGFVGGRSPRLKDIGIDACGAAMALGFMYFRKIIKRKARYMFIRN
jgi:VanZ family protein